MISERKWGDPEAEIAPFLMTKADFDKVANKMKMFDLVARIKEIMEDRTFQDKLFAKEPCSAVKKPEDRPPKGMLIKRDAKPRKIMKPTPQITPQITPNKAFSRSWAQLEECKIRLNAPWIGDFFVGAT